MKFGFLIDKKEFNCSDFSIITVEEFDKIKTSFFECVQVCDGWIYGPEKKLNKSQREKEEFKQPDPIVRDSFYRMSATHRIKTNITDDEHLRFLVLGYGFLQGLYLLPEGYFYFGRTPYEPGKLNGLLLKNDDYVNGMEIINNYYKSSSKENRIQILACIHWFSIGQSFNFEWDKFDAQYKVLDGIYRLSGLPKMIHAERPVKLASKYNIILPEWAELNSSGKSQLSILRNELVHEAKFAGTPIGYSYPSENYSLEFTSFNTKLIAAALGIDTPYLKADYNTRCRWAWDIKT
ncbi:MAG: hypothetical protein HGB36_00470 [Chlorobiaceae bacterium]|nr:hypothetical protein [Chlorobiaceae bacterium]